MSRVGHDICSTSVVHASTMIMVHACTVISACMYYDHITCMYHDHSTCMYYDHSTCMYYDQCTCMYYVHSRCMDYIRRTYIMSDTAHDQRNLGRGVWGAKFPRKAGGFGGPLGPPMLKLRYVLVVGIN